jgi:hypothetical protein
VVEVTNATSLQLTIMDEKITLVIGLTLLIVIGVNVALYFGFRNRGLPHQIELFRKAARRARNPWQDEDDALGELANLVAKLKENESLREENTSFPIENQDE